MLWTRHAAQALQLELVIFSCDGHRRTERRSFQEGGRCCCLVTKLRLILLRPRGLL